MQLVDLLEELVAALKSGQVRIENATYEELKGPISSGYLPDGGIKSLGWQTTGTHRLFVRYFLPSTMGVLVPVKEDREA